MKRPGQQSVVCCAIGLVIVLHALALLPVAAAPGAAVQATPSVVESGKTVTFKWYITGTKVLLSGGGFGAGKVVTGQTTATDTPHKTTRYLLDVWYLDPAQKSPPKTLHSQYSATVQVTDALEPQAPVRPPDEDTLSRLVAELVNRERIANGVAPLAYHAGLQEAARWQAKDMDQFHYLGHTDHSGREFSDRIQNFQYDDYLNLGENVADGKFTPAELVAAWMASPAHRANILNPDYNESGVGHCSTGTHHSWVQDFGRREGAHPLLINGAAARASTPRVQLYLYGDSTTTQARFSNDGQTWTPWESYRTVREWDLLPGEGSRTVCVEVRAGKSVARSEATILLAPSSSAATARAASVQ